MLLHYAEYTVFLLLEWQDPESLQWTVTINFTQNVVSVTNSETCQDISRYQMISNKPSNEPFIHHADHQIILRLFVAYLCIHSQGAPPWHPTIGSRNWMSRSQQSLPWIDYPKWSRAKNQLQCQRSKSQFPGLQTSLRTKIDPNCAAMCCYETSMTRAKRSLYLALPLLMNNAGWTTKKCRFSEFQLCFQKRTAKDTSLPCLSTTNER